MAEPLVPELLPARMLNEYSYCPRLFYLEWVQARFTDNDDTAEGRFHHRAVDRERGAAPLPAEGELLRTQSVLLSSERLGLVARVDVIEGDGQTVRPVDTKRGSPPSNEERSWEPERVQLCVQGLLLRDAGYETDEGVLYFAGSRTRVAVAFDGPLVARTHELIGQAREVASQDVPPPPLVDSPKCPRCSLVGICLPDEMNMLAQRHEMPKRRMASDPDARPFYVQEQGARVSVDKGRLVVTKVDEQLASVRLIDVSQLCIYGNVQISTQALRRLFALEIPTCFFSYAGWFVGIAQGLPSKHVELRRRQVALAGQGGLDVARRIVMGKITNARTLMMRNARQDVTVAAGRLKALISEAASTTSVASLLGVEGAAARTYFGSFTAMLRDDVVGLTGSFDFEGRNRRPPKDPVNALLSYVYGLLTKDLTVMTHAVGFDPYLGFYHRPRFGRPALALDLAEEFRHLIGDSVVIQVINNGEVRTSDFIVRAGGVALTAEGRKKVLRAYERRLDIELTHPIFGYRASYRRLMELQARILAAHVLGELPEYTTLATR